MRSPPTAVLTLAWACIAVASTAAAAEPQSPTQVRIVTIHCHDDSAFTEGLFFHGDALVESTGLNSKSFIRQYTLPTTTASPVADDRDENGDGSNNTTRSDAQQQQREFRFDSSMFGEGVTSIGDRLYALTYKAKVLLELSLHDFTLLNTYPIETFTEEGWGMTTDGELLIVSDGSSKIQFFDPRSGDGKQEQLKLVRTIDVNWQGKQLTNVNELEFVLGENEILANVWFQNHILRINATDGNVLEVIDLAWVTNMVSNLQTPAILHSQWRHDAVMNGIALHPTTRHVFVTGKLWDSIFELEFSYLSVGSRKKRQGTTKSENNE
ncbi:Glutamine cyclotransferase [Globisporangium polare]